MMNDAVAADTVTENSCITEPATAATVLKCNLEDGFQLPKQQSKKISKNAKPKRQSVAIGDSRQMDTFRGVAQKTVVCANCLKASTSVDTITDFLQTKGITAYSCFKVIPKGSDASKPLNFVGMRLCVPKVNADAIFKTDLWPLGVTV